MSNDIAILKRAEIMLKDRLEKLDERIDHLNAIVTIDLIEYGVSPVKEILDNFIDKKKGNR